MRLLSLLFFMVLALSANDTTHTFAPSSECKACHTKIYDEFTTSMHFKATPQKDPIHNAVWSKHPHNKKQNRYSCGKCHTPTANNLDKMLTKGQKAMPLASNATHQEAISCAYCHRIQSIQEGKQSNTNIISKEEKAYFGTRTDHVKSPFHKIITDTNKVMASGNVCAGCHSHKMNKFKLNVCSTNIDNEIEGANCVSCHMPQVKGSVSNLKTRATHTFHGFAGSHSYSKMLEKYVDISLVHTKNNFDITVDNRSSHALLLHPLRVAVLKVSIIRANQTIKMKNKVFVRIIGHNKKPAMPWKATTTLKDTMIQAKEKRTLHYDFALTKSDKVNVVLGWFLVNPKAVKKLDLEDDSVATKFIEFKKKVFVFGNTFAKKPPLSDFPIAIDSPKVANLVKDLLP